MKILITGLGITGKSTFRQLIAVQLQANNDKVVCLDLDYQRDQLPQEFDPDSIYILEDVHGPTPNAVIPIKSFDQIFYLQPGWLTHLRFWLSRMKIWFGNGKFGWDADKGEKGEWLGTGKPYDLANILPILKDFWSHFKVRKQTIKNDLRVISATGIDCILIVPRKKWGKIKFFAYDFYRS